jgi:hypothetical protein
MTPSSLFLVIFHCEKESQNERLGELAMSVLTTDPDIGKLYEVYSDNTSFDYLYGKVVFVLAKVALHDSRTWYRVLYGEDVITIFRPVHFAELTEEDEEP